jgi:hypothetical protein
MIWGLLMLRSMVETFFASMLAFLLAGSSSTLVAAPKAPAKAANPLPDPVKVASVEGITEYRLANGLRSSLIQESPPSQ